MTKEVRRLTEGQIYLILLVSYLICIPLIFFIARNNINNRDTWLEENAESIKICTASIASKTHHYRRYGGYDEYELLISDGNRIIVRDIPEAELDDTFTMYSISTQDGTYYEFTKEALYFDAEQIKALVSNITIAILLFGPVMIFLYLRETYGYGIRFKKGIKYKKY